MKVKKIKEGTIKISNAHHAQLIKAVDPANFTELGSARFRNNQEIEFCNHDCEMCPVGKLNEEDPDGFCIVVLARVMGKDFEWRFGSFDSQSIVYHKQDERKAVNRLNKLKKWLESFETVKR